LQKIRAAFPNQSISFSFIVIVSLVLHELRIISINRI
jgi:hypothetical protein